MTLPKSEIYGNQDPRSVPAYTIAEAARYLHLATATLRSWVFGRSYPRGDESAFFAPLIEPPDPLTPQLSFWNLVEAHVLRALRTKHGVPIKAVRMAREAAQLEFKISCLLLSSELKTGGGDLFLDKYGELVNLSKSRQLAMKKILEDYLTRVDWDTEKLPLRLFPFASKEFAGQKKVIVIDPYVSFGRPVIRKKNISTAVIADRVDAGESVLDLAADYGLDPDDIEQAVIYERAA